VAGLFCAVQAVMAGKVENPQDRSSYYCGITAPTFSAVRVRPLVATGARKKLNRESRQRTRKEDEDFEQKNAKERRGFGLRFGYEF
jgi:hypothetical protein